MFALTLQDLNLESEGRFSDELTRISHRYFEGLRESDRENQEEKGIGEISRAFQAGKW